MARKVAVVEADTPSLRGHLIDKCRRDIERLPTESEIYDFSAERDRLLDRLAGLQAGRPVEVHRLEIPAEILPPRGHLLYRLVGTRLERADCRR